jgi:hypothetical protein
MSDRTRQILESKRAMRGELAALPIADKIKLLELLRDRARAIATSSLKQRLARRNTV